jgi:hypothetical protein
MEGINEVINRINSALQERHLAKLRPERDGWKASVEFSLKHRNGKLVVLWDGTILKSLSLPVEPNDSEEFAQNFADLL